MTVAVLMSTYNGEKYVAEQIDSILAQNLEGGVIRLYIRDDGSSDATVRILKKYASEHENIIFINQEQIENLGIQKSFLSLLEYAFHDPENDYFAFSDQDDVWLKNKICEGLEVIGKAGISDKGVLYYSNKTFTDDNLNIIREEDIKFYNDIFEVLWKNLASGCTMILDKKLAGICLQHKPETSILHDSWIYHVAKLICCPVLFDTRSFILYRQHGDNNVGMEGAQLYHSNLGYMLKRFVPVLFLKRKHNKQKFITEIYSNYFDLIPEQNRRLAEDVIHYRYNPAAKYRLIHNQYMNKRDNKSRAVWRYYILFNRV